MRQPGWDYNAINAGLSGDTSAGGLSRIDYWLSRPVAVFVLELGISDMMRGLSLQVTRANLQAIMNKVSAKCLGVKMVLMGMRFPDFLHSPLTAQFNGIYPALANDNNMALVADFLDGVAGKARLNQPDRIHPNAEGYKVIAEKVRPVIKKIIGMLG